MHFKIYLSFGLIPTIFGLHLEPNDTFFEAFTGEPFTVTCLHNAYDPNAILQWIGPQGNLISSQFQSYADRLMSRVSNRIHRRVAVKESKENSGIYRCVLIEKDSKKIMDEKLTTVKVFKSIEIKGPKIASAPEGGTLVLKCSVNFDPDLTHLSVVWIKDGKLIKNNERFEVKQTPPPQMEALLLISPAAKEDEGQYFCKGYQGSKTSFQVRVYPVFARVTRY